MDARTKIDVVIDHEDGVMFLAGVREQHSASVEQEMLHEIGAQVREETGGIVV